MNQALDERRDPLGDDAICDALASHPEEAREVVALGARLERLPDIAVEVRPHSKSASRTLWPIAAAAAIVLVYVLLNASTPSPSRSNLTVAVESPAEVARATEPAAPLAPTPLVTLAYHSEYVLESPGKRTERISDPSGEQVRFRQVTGDNLHLFELLRPNGTRP